MTDGRRRRRGGRTDGRDEEGTCRFERELRTLFVHRFLNIESEMENRAAISILQSPIVRLENSFSIL